MINPQIAKLKEERDRLKQQIEDYRKEEETAQKVSGGLFLVLAGIIFVLSLWVVLPLADLGLAVLISESYPNNMATAGIFALFYVCAKVFIMVMGLYAFLWGLLTIFEDETERFAEGAGKWWAFHFGGASVQPIPAPAVTPEEKLAATAAKNGKPSNGSKK